MKEASMKFEELGLAEPLLRAVRTQGYHTTTKIQAAAIPPVLEGRDVLGCAQTGTGKTAAFALPTLQRLSRFECRVNGRGRKVRTLVLAPTRELALQICASFQAYGRHTTVRQAAIYGGVGQSPQVRALNQGVDVLIATPGRLLDLMQQGYVDLSRVEVLILDEADRMLDMGFIHDLRRIVAKVPAKRQTLMFSATLAPAIRSLADQWLTNPLDIRVTPARVTVDAIRQSVFFVDQKQKLNLLTHLLRETAWTRALVFTRTKHGADKVAKSLVKAGIKADAFHSNKSQSARQRVLLRFKAPEPLVLVATDIAARGLDIDDVSHVVNFDLPMDADNYVHRIGRTGRAGADGVAVSFCDHKERSVLQAIQRLTRQTLAVEECPVGMLPQPSTAGRDDRQNVRAKEFGGGETRATGQGGTRSGYRGSSRSTGTAYQSGRSAWRRSRKCRRLG
jgi:ATP-dependent RNA helicase RhlE